MPQTLKKFVLSVNNSSCLHDLVVSEQLTNDFTDKFEPTSARISVRILCGDQGPNAEKQGSALSNHVYIVSQDCLFY